jgi:hypothetical protein
MKSKFQVQEVPIDGVELDKNNPRIAKWIEMHGEDIPAEQIALALGVGDSQLEEGATTFQSLKASIRTNGGIIHPILVNREPSGRLVVIEGNTRVAIYKEFKEEKVPGDWDRIIAMVYDSMSQEEIDSIRLQAHLVGVRPWDPYSKAKYLEYLSNSEHLTYRQIVDYCGGREREVQNYIQAYLDMERYYRPLLEGDDQFDPTRFSAFVELQRPRLKEAIVNAGYNFNDFAKWVRDLKIHPLLAVRKLPLILQNPKSRDVFLRFPGKGAIQEAEKELSRPTPDAALTEAFLDQLAAELVKRIAGLEFRKLQRLKTETDSDEVQSLFDARDSLVELCKMIETAE